MKIFLPKSVKNIINTLENNGFSAYAVGGCVRDSLLGITPSDWDITTDATPFDVKKLFAKTFDTGIKHGTVSVLENGEIFELTTFRCDGKYLDNRRPQSVSFTSSLKEDLKRRDFTINAMAYNEKHGLIDFFCGADDLQNHIIRCVGDPDVRFCEDALRILRAVRFASQKGFKIHEETLCSIKKNAHLIKNLSVERIIFEITKILMADPDKIFDLYTLGVLKYIMPQMCLCFETPQNIKWHIYDVGVHSLNVVKNCEDKPYLKFSALLHDWGKPHTKGKNDEGEDSFRNHAKKSVELAEDFLNKYKFKNSDKDKILRLIKHHDREIIPEKKYVKRAINSVGEDIFLDLINLKRADCLSQNLTLTSPRLEFLKKIESLYFEIKENKEVFSVKNLDIDGNDLKNLGFRGKEIGEILNSLLDFVIENPEKNKNEILIDIIKKR